MSASEAREQTIREIARKHLRIETLDVRGRDSLDFHDCYVLAIQNALEAAYAAGFERAEAILAAPTRKRE